MKKILRTILQNETVGWWILGVFVVAALLVAWFVYSSYSRDQFGREYSRYSLAASVQQNAAFVPGAEANPLRQSLNQMLGLLLAKETKPPQRLILAREGLGLIAQMNKEIDAIGDTAPSVTESIARMQSEASSPGNIFRRKKAEDLVMLAHNQQALIQDIRGLSYRADFEITQICNHLISEKGVLTNQYTTELNDAIPATEAQFNKRQNTYNDLEKNIAAIQKASETITGASR
jgi:hypothetical protein